eukprot:scaffold5221_cov397-Prasinococcus_capsulatus_cf.AAC.5
MLCCHQATFGVQRPCWLLASMHGQRWLYKLLWNWNPRTSPSSGCSSGRAATARPLARWAVHSRAKSASLRPATAARARICWRRLPSHSNLSA